MGLLDDLFGSGTSKETKTSTYSKDIQALQAALAKGINTGTSAYLKNPSVFISPMNDYQTGVGTGVKSLSDWNADYNPTGSLRDYAPQYDALGDTSGLTARMGLMNQYIPGYSQQAIDASTVDYGDISAMANPLFDDMLASQERQRGRAYESAQRDIGDEAAGSAAFGGSGEAIRRSQLDKNLVESAADDTAELGWQSYGQAAQLAANNASARTAALQNAGTDVYNRALGANQYTDQLGDTAYSRQLQALNGGSNYGLQRASYDNNFANDYTTRNLQSYSGVGAYGDTLRAYNQEVGDAPYTQFQRFSSFIPSYQPTVTTKTPTQGGGLLGAGLALAGAAKTGNWFG